MGTERHLKTEVKETVAVMELKISRYQPVHTLSKGPFSSNSLLRPLRKRIMVSCLPGGQGAWGSTVQHRVRKGVDAEVTGT